MTSKIGTEAMQQGEKSDHVEQEPGDENDGKATIVLVGHCGADSFMLKTAVGRMAPNVPLMLVDAESGLAAHRHSGAVWLVNRVLDGSFASTDGIELIRRVRDSANSPIMLLVSNFDDAQQRAEDAGAMPGFGKGSLYDPAAGQRLQAALGSARVG